MATYPGLFQPITVQPRDEYLAGKRAQQQDLQYGQTRNALANLTLQQTQNQLARQPEQESLARLQQGLEVVAQNPELFQDMVRFAQQRGDLKPGEMYRSPEELAMARGLKWEAPPSYSVKDLGNGVMGVVDQRGKLQGSPKFPTGAGGGGFGNVNPGDYTPESLAKFAQTNNYADLVRQYAPQQNVLVNTPGYGVGLVDRRTGQPIQQFTTPQQEAEARAAQTAATTTAKVGAENTAGAVAGLPQVEANAQQAISDLEQLKNAKGLGALYGLNSLIPIVPGTEQANAFALLEKVQGRAFLQAFETLKGGGQITEVEGKKATSAITSLTERRQTKASAIAAINDLQSIIKRGLDRARTKAKVQSGGNDIDALLNKYAP